MKESIRDTIQDFFYSVVLLYGGGFSPRKQCYMELYMLPIHMCIYTLHLAYKGKRLIKRIGY
jgi:hypothetical protein